MLIFASKQVLNHKNPFYPNHTKETPNIQEIPIHIKSLFLNQTFNFMKIDFFYRQRAKIFINKKEYTGIHKGQKRLNKRKTPKRSPSLAKSEHLKCSHSA